MTNNDKNFLNDFVDIHDFVDKSKVSIYEEVLARLKTFLETLDEEIFNRPDRLSRGYYSYDKKPRTIITQFGSITIKRRRYFHYVGKKRKTVCLLDTEAGITPYERVHQTLKNSIADLAGTGNRYSDILKILEPAGISPMTVSRVIKNFDVDDIADPRNYNINKIKVDEILNIQMDDTFPKARGEKRELAK